MSDIIAARRMAEDERAVVEAMIYEAMAADHGRRRLAVRTVGALALLEDVGSVHLLTVTQARLYAAAVRSLDLLLADLDMPAFQAARYEAPIKMASNGR